MPKPAALRWTRPSPYHGLRQERTHAPDGKQVKETPNDPQKDQFALEMDHMAECVRQNKTPYTPGEEGLQDQRIMDAIYQSAKENKPVKLPAVAKIDAFRGTRPLRRHSARHLLPLVPGRAGGGRCRAFYFCPGWAIFTCFTNSSFNHFL